MTRNIISLGICVLGMVMSIIALVWVYEGPEEMYERIRDRRNYIDEDGKVVLGREGSTITSPLFELDDGTTLAEAELDWGTVDLSDVEFDSNGINFIDF